MGWYQVTKTIGGRPYLYSQRTYREGGKVRTQSRYIGPASAARGGGARHAAKQEPGAIETAQTIDPVDQAIIVEEITTTNIKIKPGGEPDSAGVPETATGRASLPPADPFKNRVDLERYNISRDGLEAEYKKMMKRMEKMGLSTDRIPRILLATGRKVGLKRRLAGGYKVTMARYVRKGTGGRNAFRHQYRKALAHVWLDEIERQNPFYFETIRTDMNDAHRHAKWELTKFILNSNLKDKLSLTLHILWTGQLPKQLQKKFAPESFGLADGDAYRGWRDDTAEVVAEVIQRGYDGAWKRTRQRWKKTDAAVRRAEQEFRMMGGIGDLLSGRTKRQLRRIKMLRARHAAVEYHSRKLRSLWRAWHPIDI